MENNDDDRDSARMVAAEGLLTAATSIELEHPQDFESGGPFLSVIKHQIYDTCKSCKLPKMSRS